MPNYMLYIMVKLNEFIPLSLEEYLERGYVIKETIIKDGIKTYLLFNGKDYVRVHK